MEFTQTVGLFSSRFDEVFTGYECFLGYPLQQNEFLIYTGISQLSQQHVTSRGILGDLTTF